MTMLLTVAGGYIIPPLVFYYFTAFFPKLNDKFRTFFNGGKHPPYELVFPFWPMVIVAYLGVSVVLLFEFVPKSHAYILTRAKKREELKQLKSSAIIPQLTQTIEQELDYRHTNCNQCGKPLT